MTRTVVALVVGLGLPAVAFIAVIQAVGSSPPAEVWISHVDDATTAARSLSLEELALLPPTLRGAIAHAIATGFASLAVDAIVARAVADLGLERGASVALDVAGAAVLMSLVEPTRAIDRVIVAAREAGQWGVEWFADAWAGVVASVTRRAARPAWDSRRRRSHAAPRLTRFRVARASSR